MSEISVIPVNKKVQYRKLIVPLLLCFVLLFSACADSFGPGIPDRGVWNGDVYTNKEANLQLTLTDKFSSYSDEEIISRFGGTNEEYENVKDLSMYVDAHIYNTEQTGELTLRYLIAERTGLTKEQYMNLVMAYKKTRNESDGTVVKKIYGEPYDLVLGGNTYYCAEYRLEGKEDEYRAAVIFRYIKEDILCYFDIFSTPDCYEEVLALFADN